MNILDIFCGNGSTWINKELFNSNKIIKNDIRNGNHDYENNFMKINLYINSDFQIDVLNKRISEGELPRCEIVYADPPHIVKARDIIFYKYGTLTTYWNEQIDNLFYNLNVVTEKILLFKWNDRSISVNTIISKAEKYFVPTIRFFDKKSKNNSYFIVFVKKEV